MTSASFAASRCSRVRGHGLLRPTGEYAEMQAAPGEEPPVGSLFDCDLGKSKRPRLPISSASILGRNPLTDNNLRPDRVFGHNAFGASD